MTSLVQLAALYFFAFASLGAYLPWLPPFLERRGFSPALIGLALALPAFCRAVFPPAWGWIADRYQARREIVVVATAVGGIALCLLGATDTVPVLLALLFLYGFVNVPVGPLAEVLTFAALGGRKERYGRIRLWGSIGFITTSVGVGYAVRSHGDAATAWGAGLPLLAAAVCASALPSARASGATVSPPERAGRLRLRLLIPIWIAAACASAAHGPYYTFFTLDLAGRGLPAHWIGLLWAWSVVAEILLMAGAPRVLGRLGLVVALRLGLVLGILRWSLYAFGPPLALLVAGQALHAATFAVVHLSAVQLVDRFSPARRKALGQSFLSATVYGAGGGLGMYLAGQFRDVTTLAGLYVAAASVCGVGLVASLAIRRGW